MAIKTSKQDRTFARTAMDIERKYDFDKSFSEAMNLAESAKRQADEAVETSIGLKEDISNSYSNATRTAEEIVFQAVKECAKTSDFGQFKSTMTTLFEQKSNEFLMTFQTLQEKITNVEGGLQAEFTEIKKYIRFVDGSIVLGEVNNPIILTIKNDRISFTQNGAEVCYISNAKMGIREVVITEKAEIIGLNIYYVSNGSICIN